MATKGRLEEKRNIIGAVEQMMRDSGLDKDKASQPKVLSDSILSMIAMAQMMGFSRSDVILALKEEWLQMKHLKET